MDQSTSSDFFAFPRLSAVTPNATPKVPSGFSTFAEQFEAATGWVLSFVESTKVSSGSTPSGKIYISDMSAAWPAGKPALSRRLCDAVAQQLDRLYQRRVGLESPNAAQAATESTGQLDEIVNNLLNLICQITETDSAGVCVLDQANKKLTFEYVNGPSDTGCDGLIGKSRRLRACEADVEALCGSLIVMADKASAKTWKSPIQCSSAICLPVSTPEKSLGTIWLWADREQDYNSDLTNFVESIANCIAKELEWESSRHAYSNATLSKPGSSVSCDPELLAFGEQVDQPAIADALVQPPFRGWSTKILEGNGYANWAVTADEQILAVVSSSSNLGEHATMTEILQGFASQASSDPVQVLKSICNQLQVEPKETSLVVAMIDPLLAEVQLAQSGFLTSAQLNKRDGTGDRVTCNFACFMSRGQTIDLVAQPESQNAASRAQLTFSKS
jgi:hypothetical protein